jgi:hypothetical protein
MKNIKQNKEQPIAGIESSSNKNLQDALVRTIEELKLMWGGVSYDMQYAIEKHVDYLYRVLKESGYNM